LLSGPKIRYFLDNIISIYKKGKKGKSLDPASLNFMASSRLTKFSRNITKFQSLKQPFSLLVVGKRRPKRRAPPITPRTLTPTGICDFGGGPLPDDDQDQPPPPLPAPPPNPAQALEEGGLKSFSLPLPKVEHRLPKGMIAEDLLLGTDAEFLSDGEVGSGDEGDEWKNETDITTAADVLRVKSQLVQVQHLPMRATIADAIAVFCNYRIASVLVHDNDDQVVGMFTARDVLREIHQTPKKKEAFNLPVHELMVPLDQMIYCKPDHTLKQCHLIMKECKVRNLPVLADGQVMGIITIKDISDYSFQNLKVKWKQNFLESIGAQKGIPEGMSLGAKLLENDKMVDKLRISVGSAVLPHPFKQENGIAFSRRQFVRQGNKEYTTDVALSEDAHFVLKLPWPHRYGSSMTYIGVADGVGSWRGLGIDPREYPQRLMHQAQQCILAAAPPGLQKTEWRPPLRPTEILKAAHERVLRANTVGSCTACVATLDHELHQLSFSNIGDIGIMVLRHIDTGLSGYMHHHHDHHEDASGFSDQDQMSDRLRSGQARSSSHYQRTDTLPAEEMNGSQAEGSSTLRIAFLSQQQFRDFNLPYQLGYTNVENSKTTFETPDDADTTSYPILPGDIVIIATDGLFDNVELDEICSIAATWEDSWFGGALKKIDEVNHSATADLADLLCERARELSLDETIDSPFAILAKENDIMWGGGMPDDCTVIAIRVVKKS